MPLFSKSSKKNKSMIGDTYVVLYPGVFQTEKSFLSEIKDYLPYVTADELSFIKDIIQKYKKDPIIHEASFRALVSYEHVEKTEKKLKSNSKAGKHLHCYRAGNVGCGSGSKLGGGCGTSGCCGSVPLGAFKDLESTKNHFIIQFATDEWDDVYHLFDDADSYREDDDEESDW